MRLDDALLITYYCLYSSLLRRLAELPKKTFGKRDSSPDHNL